MGSRSSSTIARSYRRIPTAQSTAGKVQHDALSDFCCAWAHHPFSRVTVGFIAGVTGQPTRCVVSRGTI